MAVILTETAAREIDSIISQQELDREKVCLRVGVKGGGCSGFSYILDLTETRRDSDELWEHSFTRRPTKAAAEKNIGGTSGGGGVAVAEGGNGSGESFSVKVICDPKSYLYLNGTVIDFKDEVMGRGFVFSNPNATSSCGCGSSFSA